MQLLTTVNGCDVNERSSPVNHETGVMLPSVGAAEFRQDIVWCEAVGQLIELAPDARAAEPPRVKRLLSSTPDPSRT